MDGSEMKTVRALIYFYYAHHQPFSATDHNILSLFYLTHSLLYLSVLTAWCSILHCTCIQAVNAFLRERTHPHSADAPLPCSSPVLHPSAPPQPQSWSDPHAVLQLKLREWVGAKINTEPWDLGGTGRQRGVGVGEGQVITFRLAPVVDLCQTALCTDTHTLLEHRPQSLGGQALPPARVRSLQRHDDVHSCSRTFRGNAYTSRMDDSFADRANLMPSSTENPFRKSQVSRHACSRTTEALMPLLIIQGP